MAELYVTNSLNTTKSVKFNIGLRYFVVKGDYDGDHKWVLDIGTTHSGSDGTTPLSRKIHNISSEDFDEVLESTLSELCALIDWSPFVEDTTPPYLVSASPTGSSVSIGSTVYMRIRESLPSSGMDLSNINVKINNGTVDFDISSEIVVSGDPYEYDIKWTPPR
jgi:hypothetical protein